MTKRRMTKDRIPALREKGWSYSRIAVHLETTEAYVYRVLKKAGMVRSRNKARRS